jgi:hypothetical protein
VFQLAVAIHVVCALVILGTAVSYPLLAARRRGSSPASLAALHRSQARLVQRLANPALLLLLIAGLYLAHHDGAFSKPYVGFGFVALLAVGGINGAIFGPRQRQLAQLAEHESGDYAAVEAKVGRFYLSATALLLVTIVLMVTQA